MDLPLRKNLIWLLNIATGLRVQSISSASPTMIIQTNKRRRICTNFRHRLLQKQCLMVSLNLIWYQNSILDQQVDLIKNNKRVHGNLMKIRKPVINVKENLMHSGEGITVENVECKV